MSSVLLFGTFDILHDGHRNLFEQAKIYGELHIILARDATILEVKGKSPYYTEEERLAHLRKEPLVHTVYLGSLTDKFSRIKKLNPDTIFLGYDQEVFVDSLYKKLAEWDMDTRIVRGTPYKENTYKSSLLRLNREKNNKK